MEAKAEPPRQPPRALTGQRHSPAQGEKKKLPPPKAAPQELEAQDALAKPSAPPQPAPPMPGPPEPKVEPAVVEVKPLETQQASAKMVEAKPGEVKLLEMKPLEAQPAPPPPPPSPPPVEKVKLFLVARPTATVEATWPGGSAHAQTPGSVEVPKGAMVKLVFAAPGHAPQVIELQATVQRAVAATLSRK